MARRTQQHQKPVAVPRIMPRTKPTPRTKAPRGASQASASHSPQGSPRDSPQSPTTLEEKVKRRKVTHTSEEIEFSVVLQPNVYEPLLRFLKERGLTGSEFIQLSLRAALNKSGFYSLSDQLRFGKYYGEKMETVIRADPEYIDWCMGALKNFCLDNACVTLLSEIRPDLTRKRNSEPVSDP